MEWVWSIGARVFDSSWQRPNMIGNPLPRAPDHAVLPSGKLTPPRLLSLASGPAVKMFAEPNQSLYTVASRRLRRKSFLIFPNFSICLCFRRKFTDMHEFILCSQPASRVLFSITHYLFTVLPQSLLNPCPLLRVSWEFWEPCWNNNEKWPKRVRDQ